MEGIMFSFLLGRKRVSSCLLRSRNLYLYSREYATGKNCQCVWKLCFHARYYEKVVVV